ncbi:MAG: phosphoglycerate kinase [Chloroflexi bacterium]|nr:phosphoglycerate kinase [Chloroflexota bacterium]
MNKLTVKDVPVTGKRVLVRVDFNVPLDEATGALMDDTRIRASLPTINYLTSQAARVILCSHLGRPKGKVVEKLRLGIVGQRLSQLLGQPVAVATDCVGAGVEKAVAELGAGEVLLLENVRFHPEEEANDDSFARALSRLADIYVNDAFGASHRAHASIVGITKYLPSVAGLLVVKEVQTLEGILYRPSRPFAALLGGAKISDKVAMMENIADKVDLLLIGGGMAAIFLKARSHEIGRSLVELDMLSTAGGLMAKMAGNSARLMLPVDVLVAEETSRARATAVPVDSIPQNSRIVDIGPQTIEAFSRELKKCHTVFWNGPMGIYEAGFAEGTRSMANLLAGLKANTIIGGGSTAEVVAQIKLSDKMSFVSTGGGASLRFLSGQTLPGIEALLSRRVPSSAVK